MKNKIAGGLGEDDNVSVFNDYIYTARNAFAYLWREGKLTIYSNQKVQNACKKNITQFAFPKGKEPIETIKTARIEGKYKWNYYYIPEKIKLKFYWVNEFDWLTKLDWVKEWKIVEDMKDILIFENNKGAQMKTGLLTL